MCCNLDERYLTKIANVIFNILHVKGHRIEH